MTSIDAVRDGVDQSKVVRLGVAIKLGARFSAVFDR